MAFSPSSPVTGAAVSGLTSPTYTLTTDIAPSINGKQYAISGLGGTQTGVDTNSVSKPFSLSFFRPQQLRVLPLPNPITGYLKQIPRNLYKLITRKGAMPAANQVNDMIRITTIIDVPAGVDTYEPEEVRAAISLHAGAFYANASGIADTVISGTM